MKNLQEEFENISVFMNSVSCDFVNDYAGSSMYVYDAIMEHADCATSIYYSDIITFIGDNICEINDTISEMGWDGCGRDLYKAAQITEFSQLENAMYDDLESIAKCFCIKALIDDYGILELEDEVFDDLMFDISIDTDDRISDISDGIYEYLVDNGILQKDAKEYVQK